MKKILLFTLTIFALNVAMAQEAAKEEVPAAWKRTAGIGLDFGQLAMINPKIGAGENRLNIGGAATFAANYKQGRIAWDNGLAAIFGVQKLGTGTTLAYGINATNKPFQKSADEFRASSKFGYGLKEGGKWFLAADLSFLTQLTATYDNNLLTDKSGKGAVAEFMSPAIATAALGIDYKPMPKISFFFSPVSWRAVVVNNNGISVRPIGKTTVGESFGIAKGNKMNSSAGALLRTVYTDKLAKDKLVISSNLALFGAYKAGSGVKLDWANTIGWEIYKGLQLSLGVNAFYDKEIQVQVSDKTAADGIARDAKGEKVLDSRVSVIQQLLLKYAKTF
jgi:Protein of unknown function (DUF3078)